MGLGGFMSNFEERISQLNEMIAKSKLTVFFGGAGVSTESGIPDFRSKDGLYNTLDVKFEKYSPEFLLSKQCLDKKPEVFFEFYRQKMNPAGYLPNITHFRLREMEQKGKLFAIITQNIDGLHQLAGSKVVHEIHGSTLRNYCKKCREQLPANFIFDSKDAVPKCPKCGGKVRPDVVLYGEPLPYETLNEASNAIAEADLIIVGGTSLTVYPAANLIPTWRNGLSNLVIINRETTEYDKLANLVFHENLGEVFSKIEF